MNPVHKDRWAAYKWRTAQPLLQYLPTKLAQFLGNNMSRQLGIDSQALNPSLEPEGWTVSAMNKILRDHVIRGQDGNHLRVFGGIQWENELFQGTPRARCYSFGKELQYRKTNPQVIYILDN